MGVKDAIPVPMEKVDVAGSDFFIRKLIGELTWVLGHLRSSSVDARFYWVWPPSLLMYWLWRQYVAVRIRTAIFPATVIVLLPMARVLKQPSHDPAVRAASGHSVKLEFIMFGCMVTLLQGTPRFCVVRDIAEASGLFLQ